MARSIKEIQDQIIASKDADTTLAAANSSSSTAIFRLWARVLAAAIFVLESLFDAHKAEVEATLIALQPHTLTWYQTKALAYQFGSDLPDGKDEYDNSLLDDETIEQQRIIAQAAVTEQGGAITVKVAKESGGELEALTQVERFSFLFYMAEVKDAGVEMTVLSQSADRLKVDATIYYNPQILSDTGARLDGASAEPVQDAIKAYLRNVPFDGELVIASLVDAIQAVGGVEIPHLNQVQAAAFTDSNFFTVQIRYSPISGFFRVYNPTDITLNFIANV